MLIETISIIATAIAIAGVVLNNHRMRACFVVWMFSNAITLGIHLSAGLYGLAGRDLAFLALAVHGWVKWGRR
jgi:nicotinamide riboside transporter PnuC